MAWYMVGGKVALSPTGLIFDSGTSQSFSAVWANDGEDKVTQDELRATVSPTSVINPVWDGTNINQFGAQNEVVSFNVILEAGAGAASGIAVSMSNLTGPGGALIRCNNSRGSSGIYNWTTTEAELFYVRYLQLRGLSSTLTGAGYGTTGTAFEPEVPAKLRLPLSGGVYTGGYVNRPNASKYYPDIAVPLELVPTFNVTSGTNQQIWVDIYIPKTATAGLYTGTVSITEGGAPTITVPVNLTVRNFTLPDIPNMPGLVDTSYGDVTQRYGGVTFPVIGSAGDLQGRAVLFNQQLVSHRHKVACIGDDIDFALGIFTTNPSSAYQQYTSGTAYSTANGYAGPGLNTPISTYAIGMYGHWQNTNWAATQAGFWTNTNSWETWFNANAPTVKRFVYLADESKSYELVQTWANWMATNSGVGVGIQSYATTPAVSNVAGWNSGTAYNPSTCVYLSGTIYQCISPNTNQTPPNATYWSVYLTGLSSSFQTVATLEPDLHITTSVFGAGLSSAWAASVNQIQTTSNYEFWMYNGYRPGNGTFHTEADGVDPRAMMWSAFKKGVKRWFFWEATYYDDNQTGSNPPFKDLFVESRTYGSTATVPDTYFGLKGSNGDGVLFYPGTQALPAGGTSYGVNGPFVSLRMKHWRRGIQDIDYVSAAAVINPGTVGALNQNLVPSILWENAVADPTDPSYYINTFQSWSANPYIWESARTQLANVIDGSGLAITPVSVPAAIVGTAYTQTLTVTNSTNLISWTILSGPSWLSISSTGTSTAQITGTPTAGNLTQVAIQAKDTVTNTLGSLVLYLNNQLNFPLLGGVFIAGSVQTSWGTTAFQKQVARLGVAVIGTYPGWTGGGFNMQSAAAAVKAINPNIKLFPYTNLMELEAGVGSSGSAYSPIFNAATTMNWFLRTTWPGGSITDADGNAQDGLNQTTFTVAGTGAYAGYANYLAWRAAWTAANEYPGSYWDGVYLDNVFYRPRVTADYNQSGSGQSASSAQTNWQNGYIAYAAPGGYLRAALPVGTLVLGNSADWGNGTVTAYSGMLDGPVIEGITTSQVTWVSQLNAYSSSMMNTATPSYAIYAQDGSITNYQFMRYGLCQCLLDNAYYYHSNNGSYDTVEWFDEFSFNLGAPIAGPGNATNGTYSSGAITAWKAQGTHGVWRRDFANGIAIVNPIGNGSQTVLVDASVNYWHLRGTQASPPNDASEVTAGSSVTLADGDGLILSRGVT